MIDRQASAAVAAGRPDQAAPPDGHRKPSAAARLLVDDSRPAEREALQLRLADRLSAMVTTRCAALVAQRLHAAPAAVRDALLPSRGSAGEAVDRLLQELHPAEAIRVLTANDGALETGLARSCLTSHQTSLREAVLDSRQDTAQPGSRLEAAGPSWLDQACLLLLRDGLDRLGLDSTRLDDAGPPPLHAAPSDEPAFLGLLHQGDDRAAGACLARAAQVRPLLVERAIMLRDPRALVSLAWKAGYSMQAALRLQTQLAGIPPGAALRATESGACPLGRGEMAWQLAVLEEDAKPV